MSQESPEVQDTQEFTQEDADREADKAEEQRDRVQFMNIMFARIRDAKLQADAMAARDRYREACAAYARTHVDRVEIRKVDGVPGLFATDAIPKGAIVTVFPADGVSVTQGVDVVVFGDEDLPLRLLDEQRAVPVRGFAPLVRVAGDPHREAVPELAGDLARASVLGEPFAGLRHQTPKDLKVLAHFEARYLQVVAKTGNAVVIPADGRATALVTTRRVAAGEEVRVSRTVLTLLGQAVCEQVVAVLEDAGLPDVRRVLGLEK